MKICPLGAELFMWMDGQTEMTKVGFVLRNCSNMPKNEPFFMTNNCTIQSF